MAILKLTTAWWTVAALLALSFAALADQVVMRDGEPRANFKTVRHNGGHIGIPRKGEKVSLKSDGGFREQSKGVEVRVFGFDDFWLQEGTNATYEHDWDSYLHMDNFNVLYPRGANEEGFIDIRDLDCAASKPFNLYNSPLKHWTPSTIRSNATSLHAAGLSEYFDVIAWSWKPMGPLPKDLEDPWLELNLYRIEPDGKNYSFVDGAGTIFFNEDGFTESDTWVPGEYFYSFGEGVNWLEFETKVWTDSVSASGGFDFCIDNLVLLFYELEQDDV